MGLRRDWLSLAGFVPSPARMPGGRAHLQGCAGDRWIVYRTQAACRQYAGALGKRPRCPSRLLRVRDYGRPRLRPLMGAGLKGSWLSRKSAAKLGCPSLTLAFKDAAPVRLHFHGSAMIATGFVRFFFIQVQREFSRAEPDVRLALLAPPGQGRCGGAGRRCLPAARTLRVTRARFGRLVMLAAGEIFGLASWLAVGRARNAGRGALSSPLPSSRRFRRGYGGLCPPPRKGVIP